MRERLGELLAAIVVLFFLVAMSYGLLQNVLPVKWSNAIGDVFASADQKRAQADRLSKLAASLRMEAGQELKELEPPTPEYHSKMIDLYQEMLAEINDKYRNAEHFEARAAELRRKANSSKPPEQTKQQ